MNAREKLAKYGAGVLSTADLISVVIGGKNADTVAENIAEYIGENIRDSVDATPEEFTRFDGIGENKALAIVAMMEFAKRLECETQRVKPMANNLTRRCIDAGKVLGIKLVDHVIVSDTDYKSLRFSETYNLEF